MNPEIVAELGASHCGNIDKAHALIGAAKQAGADAVKFQCWSPGSMCLDPEYVVPDGPWAGMHLQQLYEQAWMPWDWLGELVRHCDSLDLPWFSSVYDAWALAFLEQLGCPRYKIASFELTDLELLRTVASTHKPMVLSTGMADYAEIAQALRTVRYWINGSATLLHCVSAYPCQPKDAALHRMDILAEQYRGRVTIGLSDHSDGWLIPVLATARGARMIEKHLMLDQNGNLDASFALDPESFAFMVRRVREAVAALGEPDVSQVQASSASLRRSLYVAQDASPGDSVVGKVRSARPAEGLALHWWPKIQDMRFIGHVKAGTPLKMDMLTLSPLPCWHLPRSSLRGALGSGGV